ncbi:MAG TPA: hypothetical protein VN914_02090 [Polyangia bacterium]|nr:hypothetical protein [Polyangia bacterium]
MTRHLSRLSRLARWRYLRWAIAAPALPLVLWACNANPLKEPNPLPEQQNDQYYEVNPVRDIDILFLIDNSPSMEQEQGNLRRNFPVFMDELKKIPGGLPNVHIGVVSSELGAGSKPLANGGCPRPGGDRGIFQTKANCGLDAASLFISSFNNQTMNNFQGPIENVFSCMANLGVAGCGYEHQLQATRVALYETVTAENKGFLRDDAFLAIILITDEDDCSAETTSDLFTDDATFPMTSASFRCSQVGHFCDGKAPPVGVFDVPLESCMPNPAGRLIKVTDIVDSIRALKKRPDQQILVSGIFGWPNNPTGARYRYVQANQGIDVAPICQSMNGDAAAGLRLKQFVESFGASGTFFSICQDDFSPAMKTIGEKLAAKLGNPCISAPVVDTKPTVAGVQPDCQVIDRVPAKGGYKDVPLPPCSSGNRVDGACWNLAADGTCGDSGFKIDVDRGGMLATPGTQQAIKCLTCTKPGDMRCMH